MLRRMLIGAAILVALMAAPAAAQYPFNVSPGTVVAGADVTISGSGCAPQSTVSVKVTQRATGKVVYTGSGQTDAQGEFTFTFKMPADAAPGWYDLEARCPLDGSTAADSGRALQGVPEGNDLVFRAEIYVTGETPATTAPSTGSGGTTTPIVRTGSDLNGLGLAGAGLITVGGIILIATRSRRHARA